MRQVFAIEIYYPLKLYNMAAPLPVISYQLLYNVSVIDTDVTSISSDLIPYVI